MKATFSTCVDVVHETGAYIVVPPALAKLLKLADGTVVLVTVDTRNGE